MKKLLHYIPFLIILCTTILLFVRVNQSGKDAGAELFGSSQMVGKQVADMELDTIFPKNGKIEPGSYQGKYTVLNMFASWCVACLEEHKIFGEFKGSKIELVGIAWRDKQEDTKEWLKRHGNPFKTVGADVLGKYGILMGVTGIPETFLIDPKGKIIMHFKGPLMKENIEEIKNKVEGK